MFFKEEFLDGAASDFIQVGSYDEEELRTLGQRQETNVSLELDALHCLRYFPCVTNLILRPGTINKKDLCYLYRLPIKRLKLDYYADSVDEYTLDLGWFRFLDYVYSRSQFNFQNAKDSKSLRTVLVHEWYTDNLSCLGNTCIESLQILSGKLKSVKGIERMRRLKSFSVSNQRALTDLAGLEQCSALEHLEINCCNKLVSIPKLEALKSLQFYGRQELESCAFFSSFPNLEELVLGVKIVDGDLSALMKLKHCALLTDHRHYSYKDKDLPKLERERLSFLKWR